MLPGTMLITRKEKKNLPFFLNGTDMLDGEWTCKYISNDLVFQCRDSYLIFLKEIDFEAKDLD